MHRLSKLSGPPARFIRKQFNRIEAIRQKQLEAIDGMKAELLAYRREVLEDVEFDKWAKVSLKRYPVVNAYLGR